MIPTRTSGRIVGDWNHQHAMLAQELGQAVKVDQLKDLACDFLIERRVAYYDDMVVVTVATTFDMSKSFVPNQRRAAAAFRIDVLSPAIS